MSRAGHTLTDRAKMGQPKSGLNDSFFFNEQNIKSLFQCAIMRQFHWLRFVGILNN